jgi:hypothetical protein
VDEDEHAEPEGLSDITLNGKSKSVEKIEDFVEKNPPPRRSSYGTGFWTTRCSEVSVERSDKD